MVNLTKIFIYFFHTFKQEYTNSRKKKQKKNSKQLDDIAKIRQKFQSGIENYSIEVKLIITDKNIKIYKKKIQFCTHNLFLPI